MRLVALDVETSAGDPYAPTCKIVEIALYDPDSGKMLFEGMVNPGCPIEPEATEVHGIRDEDVRFLPGFGHFARHVQEALEGRTILTYCGRSFDVVIVDRELREAGQPGIDLEACQEIDLYRCWIELEPHTLEGAVRRYLGREHEGSHSAAADAEILGRLLNAVCSKHRVGLEELAAMSRPASEVDRSGRLYRDEDGVVCFAFGKHKDEPVSAHRGYARWMYGADFPRDTKEALVRIFDEAKAAEVAG